MSENAAQKNPPPLPKGAPSRLPRMILLLVLLLLATALVIWYASVRLSNASAIRKLEQEARQRGEPLTLTELQAKYPPIPDAENAAVELMALWETEDPVFWKAFANGERPLPEGAVEKYDPALPYLGSDAQRVPRVGPLDSNSLAAAESYLSAKASHLEQVRSALRRPRFRFPIKFEEGPEAHLPHLARIKTEAQNFRIVALLASESGGNDAAILAVKNVAQTGQILSDEPVLISQLVRVACLNLALDGVEQLLSRQRLSADELEKLRLFLEGMNLPGLARSTLVNERPFALSGFDPEVLARAAGKNPADDDNGNPEESAQKTRLGLRLMRFTGYSDLDRRLMLEAFHEAIELGGQETPGSLRRMETLFEEVSAKARKFPPKIFSALLLPAFQIVSARIASLEARRRAGLIALAVERFRLEHGGRIPETLEEVVPACLSTIPPDPFDGNPLRFRKLERGFVVYSIGDDREDDGGKERVRSAPKHTDITFIVERD